MRASELLRMACVYALQDREAFLDAHEHCRGDESYDDIIKDTEEYIRKLQKYMKKRWGRAICDHA